MAIKVNLVPREATSARSGIAIGVPRPAIGGNLVVQLATGVLVLLALGLGVAGYRAYTARDAYRKEVTDLRARNEALKLQLSQLREAEEAKRDIQRRIEIIGRVAKSQGVPLQLMNGVLRAIPQGVWLNSLEMKPQEEKVRVERKPGSTVGAAAETLERLERKQQEAGAPPPAGAKGSVVETTELKGFGLLIRGTAFNNLQVADFMENLRKIGVFSDVDFTVTQAGQVEQARVMTFEVTAAVKL